MNRILKTQIKDYIKSFFRPGNLIVIPEIVDKPEGRNVLVLSPHFDDDIFGCGGTLRKHVLSGDKVSVIYFTDGREGDPSVPDKDLVRKIRKEEAVKATSAIGIKNLFFFDQPETNLKPTATLIKRLAEIFNSIKPDLIYLPSFLDNHVDHFELNRIFLLLFSEIKLDCNVCAYELWTPLLPNILVDISKVVSKKREAAEQHASQIRQVNYIDTMLALNRYRSIMVMRGEGYAEAFFCITAKEYIKLLKTMNIKRRAFMDRNILNAIRKFSRILSNKDVRG
jgi:LmbE family N-acetylglucosaminyl deacetylase